MKRHLLFFISLTATAAWLLFGLSSQAMAAFLDDLYGPLLDKGDFYYSNSFYCFDKQQSAINGGTTFEAVKDSPRYYTIGNGFRFAPWKIFEINLEHHYSPSSGYRRTLYSETDSRPAAVYNFELAYFQDYRLHLRARHEPLEFFLDFNNKYQKTKWDYALLPGSALFWSRVKTRYQDATIGLRYADNASKKDEETSSLSILTKPLPKKNHGYAELTLNYRQARLRNDADQISSGFLYRYNHHHDLTARYTPSLILGYGLSEALTIETGASITTPFEYKYLYKLYYQDNTSASIPGIYKISNTVSLPLTLRLRPQENWEISIANEYKTSRLRLEYWDESRAGLITRHPVKKVTSHVVRPSLKIAFLHTNGKTVVADKFLARTKPLLSQGQWLAELNYQKDITRLKKNSAAGSQNMIEPDSLFLYPLDYFLSGTEYATAFLGNFSRYAGDTSLQNYHHIKASLNYGISNTLNMQVETGYRSASAHHAFSLYDKKTRYYKFQPNYYFNLNGDLRLNKNTIISVTSHFVPFWKTSLDYEGDPQQYKSKSRYLETAVKTTVSF